MNNVLKLSTACLPKIFPFPFLNMSHAYKSYPLVTRESTVAFCRHNRSPIKDYKIIYKNLDPTINIVPRTLDKKKTKKLTLCALEVRGKTV